MGEVFLYAVHRKQLFDKGFSWDYLRPLGDPSGIAILRANLPNPAGVTVTGRSEENVGMNFPEMEGFQVAFKVDGHGSSLMEKGISPNALWRLGDSGIVWIGEVFGFLIIPESEQ